MTTQYGRRPYWEATYDEDDDTPPVQRWLRAAWASAKDDYQQRMLDVRLLAQDFQRRPKDVSKSLALWTARRVVSLVGLLVILWMAITYRGEFAVFESSIAQCDWARWEQWPQHASPHRLVFVADPQLVDPHTYPGRPWPLSTLTVKHSDLYMRRAYFRIQRDLFPDTIMFLGDLFDGGREWSTTTSASPYEEFHQYGDVFWQKEYGRFSNIFLKDWRATLTTADAGSKDNPNIRIIASLPGNHDLGFGGGIQLPVRERFNAFFGDSNRIDIIGNHTFVSVDTVSLSAMEEEEGGDAQIWRPAYEFLHDAKSARAQAIEKHLRHIEGDVPDQTKHSHRVEDIDRRVAATDNDQQRGPRAPPDIPTVLLTHVPLGRSRGMPCGPLRERWPPTTPPSGQTEPLDPDERNALDSEGRGVQYKNSLTPKVSNYIADSLDGTISHAFSGDDHDFCEVVHKNYASLSTGIKEITVKSLSWTMGVRKPGFLLASLWNPIDSEGHHVDGQANQLGATIQTHLCLLPDQISILIGYGIFLGVSLVLLALQATYDIFLLQNSRRGSKDEDGVSLLPTSDSTAGREKMNGSYGHPLQSRSQANSSSSEDTAHANLSARTSAATRPRSVSPLPSYGFNARPPSSQPLVSYAVNRKGWEEADSSEDVSWGAMRSRSARKPRPLVKRSLPAQFGILFARRIWQVARIVFLWYAWLLYL